MKKTKAIKYLIFTLVLGLIVSSSVSAATYETVSIGTNYEGKWIWDIDIDSSNTATISYNQFKSMGYTSFLYTKPNYNTLIGTNLTGTKVLESTVVHLAGHANSTRMTFKYNNSSDYETGVYYDYNYIISGVHYAGIRSFNMSKVKLLIFQGCNTAAESDNITKRANQYGATTTIGWYDKITTESNEKWIKNFTVKLSQGASVSSAVSYANSQSYSDPNVKKVNIYGNGNLKLVGVGGIPVPSTLSRSDDNNTLKEYVVNLPIKDNNTDKVIADYIIENINPNFDESNYLITKINDNLYDFLYLIDGTIRTDMGYTIELQNNVITKIYDNMKNIDNVEVQANKNQIKSNQKDIDNVIQKYSNDSFDIEDIEEFDYYDSSSQKINHVYRVTVKDIKNNTLGVYDEVIS